MDEKDIPLLKVGHHLNHVAEMCGLLASMLEEMVAESAGDKDSADIIAALQAVSDDARLASDDVYDRVLP